MSVYEIVSAYYHAGLNTIPIKCDGSKAPALGKHSYFTEKFPEYRLRQFLTNDLGIGICCGQTSGGLEVLDFDSSEIFPLYFKRLEDKTIFKTLPLVETPSGWHLYWRCSEYYGQQTLARDDLGDLLIETRGQGNYVVAPGSPIEVHKLKVPYRLIRGSLLNVPTISVEARNHFLSLAKTFNNFNPTIRQIEKPKSKLSREQFFELTGCWLPEKPWDRFNREANWQQILKGWTALYTAGGKTYWRRPNKSFGISATTNNDGTDRLYNFSSSVQNLETNRYYTKSAALAELHYGGNFSSAGKALARIYNEKSPAGRK